APAFAHFLRDIRAQHIDLTLDLQRHLKSGLITRASAAPVRVGFHRVNAREGNWLFTTHRLAPMAHFSSKLPQFLAFADWLEIERARVTFGLHLHVDEELRVDELLREVRGPFVAAFLGSSCESRLWFVERTAAAADAMAERGLQTVLLGGPADTPFAAAVATA